VPVVTFTRIKDKKFNICVKERQITKFSARMLYISEYVIYSNMNHRIQIFT